MFASFRAFGTCPFYIKKLKTLHRTGASSLEQVFKKIGRMSSGPGDLEVSRFFRASKTSSTEKKRKRRSTMRSWGIRKRTKIKRFIRTIKFATKMIVKFISNIRRITNSSTINSKTCIVTVFPQRRNI